MKSLFSFLLFFSIVLISCKSENKKNAIDTTPNINEQKLSIKDYIKKFKLIQFPFYFNNENIDRNQLFELSKNSNDTLFYKFENEDKVYGYGILEDTTNYYSLIYFGVAEGLYPVLCTYSKGGQMINKEILIVHGCGSDCGLRYCSYSVIIKKDYSIYLADTLKYEGTCDSLGNYLPNSGDSTFINSKTGLVDKSGNIKVDPEKVQRFKNIR